MKRVSNLFVKIIDIENIIKAHRITKKDKAHYDDVKMFEADPYKYANFIREMLMSKTWTPSPVIKKSRIEGGKKRITVDVTYYPDRIIHQAVMNVVEPVLRKVFIKDTYQSIKGRGLHQASQRVRGWLKYEEETQYCLQVDIEKFYPSVKHSVVKSFYRKKIKCKDTLYVLDTITESDDGLPLGFCSSPTFGNLLVSYMDHYIKSLGAKFYVRYADDIVIFHKSKEFLHLLRVKMQRFMSEKLELKMKNNYKVFPLSKCGLDFLGYVFFRRYTLIRKSIVQKMKRVFRKRSIKTLGDMSRVMSYLGWLKWANSYNLKRVLVPYVKNRVEDLAKRLDIRNPLRNVYLLDKPKKVQLSFSF